MTKRHALHTNYMHYMGFQTLQRVIGGSSGNYRFLELPDADEWVVPGVRWGAFEHALTPAFWVSQAWLEGTPEEGFQLCNTLVEEVVTCLLGGHGAPAEVGLAASKRVIDALNADPEGAHDLAWAERLLTEPLTVNDRQIRYRFASQRAKYLAGTLAGLNEINEGDLGDLELRDALCGLPGIGPKTASWIVRNRRGSDAVAILDVHIVRACVHMGVFPEKADPARHYLDLERRFLDFCNGADAKASLIDAVMWGTMRQLDRSLMKLLIDGETLIDERLPLLEWGKNQCQVVAERAATPEAMGRVKQAARRRAEPAVGARRIHA
ncbi:MAG: endonuclease III domain-containing protein [Brevundimonas diminuta]|nr:endonuclease III domain-containing protein [Brevundimonas diminuta]MBD3818079.1 endonuclease III domain-containing protein [Brevundimonas diminuta]